MTKFLIPEYFIIIAIAFAEKMPRIITIIAINLASLSINFEKSAIGFKIPVNIVSAPTIRDLNELALSSRNTRLTESEKKAASVIFQALATDDLEQAKAVLDSQPLFKLDYLNLIDEKTFADAHPSTENKRLIIAGWVNQVRLIDNKAIGGR